MRELVNQTFIVSAWSKLSHSRLNMERHADACNSLLESGIPFKEVSGVYKGRSELAILLTNKEHAFRLAAEYEQESVFVRYSDKSCYMHWLGPTLRDGREFYLGQWRESTTKPAGDHTAYNERFYYAFR